MDSTEIWSPSPIFLYNDRKYDPLYPQIIRNTPSPLVTMPSPVSSSSRSSPPYASSTSSSSYSSYETFSSPSNVPSLLEIDQELESEMQEDEEFSHIYAPIKKMVAGTMCRYWMTNQCTRDNCGFVHETIPGIVPFEKTKKKKRRPRRATSSVGSGSSGFEGSDEY